MPFGPLELIIILVLVVVFFGARKLPQLGKGLGQSMREFKKGMNDDEATPAAKKDEA
ncbi:twin-arginine translocase TatA/TatE family subunit [Deinococcus yavapaiensis]|uniref:Sec-independent protein translocase protein TatA n=1 Tax=Deinococcus yavapaiensis KR-236 TaxID=694435 RepID=A0A318S5S3_9DEIO|nr:twin-arginine translocase TatA/TatE family subunit [Deinococcus yavapaiensis]PYE53060.1 sec-independent protein translocase protein TatA [Deinococcus yavapaiensis KR-236]